MSNDNNFDKGASLSPGDRVASVIYGMYIDEPARVIKPAEKQFGNSERFLIEFDNSGKRVVMPANYLRVISEE